MSSFVKVLNSLGYRNEEQRIQMVKLYHLMGAFTNGVYPTALLSDDEAHNYLNVIGAMNVLSYKTVDDKGNPKTIECGDFNDPIKVLSWLNEVGQAVRAKIRTGERQQMQTPEAWQEFEGNILKWLENLGFINEVKPVSPNVDALLILGASEAAVKTRIKEALDKIKDGNIDPEGVYLVTGARDLWPEGANEKDEKIGGESLALELVVNAVSRAFPDKSEEEIQNQIKEIIRDKFSDVDPQNGKGVMQAREAIIEQFNKAFPGVTWPTETDLMKHCYQDAIKNYPEAVGNVPMRIVDAPKIIKPDGTLERPNTNSTLGQFDKDCYEEIVKAKQEGQDEDKDKVSVIVISSQPHCRYQEGVVRNVLDASKYDVQVVGPAVDPMKFPKSYRLAAAVEAVITSVYSWRNAERMLEGVVNQVSVGDPVDVRGKELPKA